MEYVTDPKIYEYFPFNLIKMGKSGDKDSKRAFANQMKELKNMDSVL